MHLVLATLGVVGLPPTVAEAGHILFGACGSYGIHLGFVKVKGPLLEHRSSFDDSPHVYNLKGSPVHRLYAKIKAVVAGTDIDTATGV